MELSRPEENTDKIDQEILDIIKKPEVNNNEPQ